MGKVTFFFIKNEDDNTVGVDVEMEFIPRVGESVQGFFATGRNGTWIVKDVNYQLYENDDKLEVHYSVSLRKWDFPNDQTLETFKKSDSGENVFTAKNVDDLCEKLDIKNGTLSDEELKAKEFSMFEAMKNSVVEENYGEITSLKENIDQIEKIEKEIQNLVDVPLSISLDKRIFIYKNMGRFSGYFSKETLIKKFIDFLDTPDDEIFDELIKNKHLYQDIFVYQGREVKESTVLNKVKEFIRARNDLYTEALAERACLGKNYKIESLENKVENLSEAIERIEYLQNQPVDKLSFFRLEKGKKINPLLETGEWCIRDDLEVIHADFNNFEANQKNAFYVEIDVPSAIKGLSPIKGWLPKEYYKLQYERLSLMQKNKN